MSIRQLRLFIYRMFTWPFIDIDKSWKQKTKTTHVLRLRIGTYAAKKKKQHKKKLEPLCEYEGLFDAVLVRRTSSSKSGATSGIRVELSLYEYTHIHRMNCFSLIVCHNLLSSLLTSMIGIGTFFMLSSSSSSSSSASLLLMSSLHCEQSLTLRILGLPLVRSSALSLALLTYLVASLCTTCSLLCSCAHLFSRSLMQSVLSYKYKAAFV